MKGGYDVGMTDLQFKVLLRNIVSELERIANQMPENKDIWEMLEKYQKALED
jgi:hypothetical protein